MLDSTLNIKIVWYLSFSLYTVLSGEEMWIDLTHFPFVQNLEDPVATGKRIPIFSLQAFISVLRPTEIHLILEPLRT